MITRIRFPCHRKPAEPTPAPVLPPSIVQREDGMFALGWHDDAPGPFESRAFAEAVAAKVGAAA